ncbi:nnp-1 protein putative nuclear protein 1 nop52 [Anaeramoeba flamelloides]|uniref:Nnp-1 protein putative nuclear protein 1 nop52 n=1 Tax=Anaeramoeba flamelloides TaxID=1746091 RepID=A0ABQ8ZAS3_9EUKA|nr:nnp-1 protein putative nuclear protein 1 nop52 [Anaeramoeba flamelloides]
MFLVTKPKTLQEIIYDPSLAGGSTHHTKNKSTSFKKSLFFMQEILQNPHLSIDEAFSPSCIQLLNLVNVLRPTRKNKVIKTSSRSKQRKGNLLEFLGVIKKSEYSIRDFPITEYLKGETSAQKQIALMTLHLQSEYEKNGIQPSSEKDLRKFLVFDGSLTHPNTEKKTKRITGVNPFLVSKKSVDLFQNMKVCEFKNIFSHSTTSIKKFVKLRSTELGHPLSEVSTMEKKKKKKKKTNDNAGWDAVDLENIDEDQDFPIKSNKQNKKNYSPKKRSKQSQFDSSDDGFGSSSSRQNDLDNYPKDDSSQDFDDMVNNQKGFNFPDSDSNQNSNSNSNSNRNSDSDSEPNQFSFSKKTKNNSSTKKQKKSSKYNSNISSSQDSENSDNQEDGEDSDNFSNKRKKQKKPQSTSEKSNTKRNKSNKKQRSSDRKVKNYNKSDNENDSTSNSNIDKDTNEDENGNYGDSSNNNKSNSDFGNDNQDGGDDSNNSNSDGSGNDSNDNRRTPKKKKKKKLSKSATNPPLTPKRSQKENQEKKLSVPLELSPYEGSHAIIPLLINKKNIYLRKDITQIFRRSTKNKYKKQIIKSPKTRAYLFLIFYLINTLDNWKKNSKTKSNQFSKKYGFDPYQLICSKAYREAKDLGKNGRAIFQVKIAKGNHRTYKSGIIELNKKELLLKYSFNQDTPLFKLPILKETFQIAVKKKDPSEISILQESMKKNQRDKQFKIKFDDEIKAIWGMITIMYFYNAILKNRNSKNSGIGQNPIRTFEKPIEELAEHVMPPLTSPNNAFNKLLSGVNHIDPKDEPKNILLKYVIDGGVNFLVAVVNEKEFPLSSGFLKIRKNKMKIGIDASVAYTIPWKSRPEIKKNQDNSNFFVIEWTQTATCSASTIPSVSIVCTRASERSLITRTIIHFYKEWKKINIKD